MNVVSGLVHQNKENIAEQNGKSDNQQFKTLGELDLNRPTPSQLRKSQTPIPVETSVSKACQTQLPPRDFPAGPCSTTSNVESGLVILSEEFYDNLWRLVREDKLCVPTHHFAAPLLWTTRRALSMTQQQLNRQRRNRIALLRGLCIHDGSQSKEAKVCTLNTMPSEEQLPLP